MDNQGDKSSEDVYNIYSQGEGFRYVPEVRGFLIPNGYGTIGDP